MSTTETNAAPPPPGLRAEHLAVLAERAITPEFALLAGLYSVDGAEAGRLLGWPSTAFPGLAIPYPGIEPLYVRIRGDGDTAFARYLCPMKREVPIYTPPSLPDAPTVTGRIGDTPIADALFVVEAPLKALALCSIGLSVVGLSGAATTLTKKDRRLNGSWDRVAVKDRLVVVVLDGNRRCNPGVATAEARLVWALTAAHARSVLVADLPEGPRGREYWGPDDYLAAEGPEALLDVIARAVDGDPLKRVKALGSEDIEAAESLLGDWPFLAAVIEGGDRVRASAARLLAERGVGKRAFGQALTKYERAAVAKQAAARAEEEGDDHENPYTCEGGRFVFTEGSNPGPICNFVAEIVEQVRVDDGAEASLEFIIEGETEDGRKLPRITVPAREFASSSAIWATAEWGAHAIVRADCMMHIHPAIQYNSDAKTTDLLAHTGWKRIDGTLVYLTAGGVIGGIVNAQVRLDSTLQRYSLPAEPSTRGQIIEATRAALLLLDVAPDRVTIPSLATVFRAPLCEWLSCDAVVWLYGPTGALKSSLAALLLGFYGATFDRERLTASWQDTAASLEFKLFRAKDVLAVIDDFAPRGVEDRDDLRRKAAQVIRGVGNGQNRGRMTSNLTARPDRPPRALVMGTGEDMPSGESIVARTFPIGVRREDIDLAKLSVVQSKAHLFPIVMRAYIEQTMLRVAADPEFAGTLHTRFEGLRSDFSAGGHLRAPAAAAHLSLGWQAFCNFAAGIGAITQDEAEALKVRGDAALREQLEVQATTSHDEDAVRRWLKSMRNLIAGGLVRLETEDVEIRPEAGSACVGWRCPDGKTHLLPDLAYAAVAKAMRETGRGIPIKDTTLWSRLEELGHTTRYETGRQGVKRTHAGQRVRVIELVAGALEEEDGPGGGGGVAPPVAAPAPIPSETRSTSHDPVPSTTPAGTAQHAVTHQENASGHGCPVPAGGGVGARADDLSATTAPTTIEVSQGEALPPGDTGTTGTGGGGGSKKLCGVCVLPPSAAPSGARDSSGTAGTGVGQLLTDPTDLPGLACAIEAAGVVGLDIETAGQDTLDPRRSRPRLLQLALPDGSVRVVDLFATGGPGPLVEALSKIEVVGHNLGFDLGFLRHHFGIAPRACWDSMLASQLVSGVEQPNGQRHPKGYHSLEAVLERALGVKLDKTMQKSDWSGLLTGEQIAYAADDVAHLFPLREALERGLQVRSLGAVMQIENALLPAMVGLRLAGVPVNLMALDALAEERARVSVEAKQRVEAALHIANANSAVKQLLPALRALGFKVTATNAEALAPYQDHPVVRDLQAMRTEKKTADDARELAAMARAQPDGRVRPDWRQIGAPTGRMSTSDPNMLGLPKDPGMRACIAAPPGRTFIIADYAAIELRVLAHVTGDKRLTAIFRAGGDPHRALAAILLNKPPTDVTSDERKRAKPVNFGFCFGMGVDRFVAYALKDYGVVFTPAEARGFKGSYLSAYREVDAWQQRTRARMEREVRTVAGRVRNFASAHDGYTDRLNMPIQGTAADGMKRAMALLAPRLARHDAQIILAVHDELVVEAPEAAAEEVKAIVVAGMIEGMAVDVTSVPIVVEAEVRRTWGKP